MRTRGILFGLLIGAAVIVSLGQVPTIQPFGPITCPARFTDNVLIGATSAGTNALRVLALKGSTAPTSSPADTVQLFAGDINGTAGAAGLLMRTENSTASLIVPGVVMKTDTGAPAYVFEGLVCINTFDNTVSVYADGGWRQLATW